MPSGAFNGVMGSAQQTGTNSDDESHGTHVPASIVGKGKGVAKKAKAVDVKVFSGGSVGVKARELIRDVAVLLVKFWHQGATSQVLAGLSWAVTDIILKGAKATSIINMSP